jgi:folate-dependent phosphoribosylglycinamide formyltransferase PurN
LAVNLLAPLGERYGGEALAEALRASERLGYRLVRIDAPDERLCAWIDWQFAPSWWSSEVRDGSAWYALAADGTIAGFAAFGSPDRSYHWLQTYRKRPDVGLFGPYGVAEAHRKTGIGEVLLTAALCALGDGFRWALIPAVSGERLIASYEERTDAHVADSYDYALRPARAVILASGNGSNAQAVIDDVQSGDSTLDVVAVISNHENARVRERARDAWVTEEAIVWDRAAQSRAQYDAGLIAAIARYEPELILLLGWMHLLPAAFLERFPETINVHPAFLPFDPAVDAVVMPDGTQIPAFRGARAPEATIAAAVAWAGASVHRVTEAVDRGGILVRTPFQLEPGTTLDRFRERIRPIEHAAVTKAIRRWCLSSG